MPDPTTEGGGTMEAAWEAWSNDAPEDGGRRIILDGDEDVFEAGWRAACDAAAEHLRTKSKEFGKWDRVGAHLHAEAGFMYRALSPTKEEESDASR